MKFNEERYFLNKIETALLHLKEDAESEVLYMYNHFFILKAQKDINNLYSNPLLFPDFKRRIVIEVYRDGEFVFNDAVAEFEHSPLCATSLYIRNIFKTYADKKNYDRIILEETLNVNRERLLVNDTTLKVYDSLKEDLLNLSYINANEVLRKVIVDMIDFNKASIIQEEDADMVLEAPSCEMVAQWDVDDNKYYFDCDGE